MLFKWVSRPLKRIAYKRRRSIMEGDFHNIASNRLSRVLIGLELLTEPLEYGGSDYVPLSLEGGLDLRTPTITILKDRLDFLFSEYNRVLGSTLKNPEWVALPQRLSVKEDKNGIKWLDEYFNTSDPEKVRDVLRLFSGTFLMFLENDDGKGNTERDVFLNQTSHILRELETIVEHYL